VRQSPPETETPLKRKSTIVAIVVAAAGALAFGYALKARRAAEAGSLPDLVQLAPADSTLIAYADVAALRQSPILQHLAELAQPTNVDHDYAEFVHATGFDYQRDLDRVAIAGRAGAPAGHTLIFGEGHFNHEKIQQYALRSGKLESQNGRSVYVVPSAAAGKNASFVFLGAERIVISDGEDIPDDLGKSSALFDPALRERLLRVAGAPLFVAAKISAYGGLGSNTAGGVSTPLGSLRWLNFAARPENGDVILSAEGECDTADQAQKVASALEFLRGALRGGLGDPKARGRMPASSAAAAERLLGAASVTTAGERVRLLVTVTPDLLGASVPPAPTSR
jgi:hypothetical protein